jgi:hypothetical protein
MLFAQVQMLVPVKPADARPSQPDTGVVAVGQQPGDLRQEAQVGHAVGLVQHSDPHGVEPRLARILGKPRLRDREQAVVVDCETGLVSPGDHGVTVLPAKRFGRRVAITSRCAAIACGLPDRASISSAHA